MNPAGAVLLSAIFAAAVQGLRLAHRWSKGRPAQVDWSRRIPAIAHAYLHVVHDVVARDAYAARMHALAAGGVLAALVISLPLHVAGLWPAVLSPLVLLALVAAAIGIGMAAARRRNIRTPRRLSGGSYAVMPLALASTTVFLAGSAVVELIAPQSLAWVPVVALGGAGLGCLVYQAYGGATRHVLAGSAHLIVHPRPDRLEGKRDTALRSLDLDDASEPLGTGRMEDFAWNRLVSFDACVQCGKCEDVCPAFAAGQPLNPKALINELVRATGPGVGAPYQGSPHPGRAAGVASGNAHMPLVAENLVDGFIDPDTLWACTTCRACVYECPMLIEHVDAVVDIRRFATLELGQTPERVAVALTETRQADTPSGRALEERFNWAAGLDLPVMSDVGACDVLLWVGESGFDRRNQKTLRSLISLLRRAGVDFAILGKEELDSGDSARRLGDEAGFQRLAKANIAMLAGYRFNSVLTADPHVMHSLAKEYPAFGGHYSVQHHSVYLDHLLEQGRLRLADFADDVPRQQVTFHDPCYLGRYGGEIEAPRRLLDRLGFDRVEMERSGMRSSCCGGGGGAPLSDIAGPRRIPDMRMDQARATGAGVVVVGCPNCMVMLEGVVGPRPEVVDLAELLLERLEPAA